MDTGIKITPEFLKTRPLSYSSLKAFRKSPKHYIEYLRQPKVTTDAFLIGQITEYLVFQPSKFDSKYMVFDKIDKRTVEGKAKWNQICAEADQYGKILVDRETFNLANCMATSVKTTKETVYYIDKVKSLQKKIEWTDKKTGIPIIGFIDAECDINETLIIVDFKTANSSDPDDFIKDAAKFDYEIQVGSYLTGYHKKYYLFPEFMFMVVEKEPPYNSIMIHCPPDYCYYAKDCFENLLTAFKYCMDNDEFDRGYSFWDASLGYFNMDVPKWKKIKMYK